LADPTPAPITRRDRRPAPRLLVASRLVLLVLAAAAAVAAFVPDPPVASSAGPVGYRCPMHPEARAPAPGVCPICGMALERAPAGAGSAAPAGLPGAELGLDPARLGRVERRVISDSLRAPAWVDARGAVVAMLYRDDAAGLAPDEVAVFYPAAGPAAGPVAGPVAGPAAGPAAGVRVRRAAGPPEDWDTATVRSRFDPVDPGALVPGAEGWLAVAGRPRDLLVVPASAILDGPRPYVLAVEQGRITRRQVQVGRTHRGAVAVLAGLSAGEQIVVAGAFLLDPGDAMPGGAP
jgi:hypothetical protein